MSEESEEQECIYAILLHPRQPCILMQPKETGWILPHASVERLPDVGDINRAMQEILKTRVTVLYHANAQENIYALENREPIAQLPSGYQWMSREMVANSSLARPEQGPVIETYLAEVETNSIPKRRPPWARRGWLDSAEAWIESQLNQLGYTRIGAIEQIRTWTLSCVLRVGTESGNLYFKAAASLPLFGHEPLVTQGLCTLYPDQIPTVLAINRERNWMLMEDFGEVVGWEASVEERETILRKFSQIHLDSITRVDELFNMGCLDRRLSVLETHLDGLLDDTQIRSILNASEVTQLQKIIPQLKIMIHQLADYEIPNTLVHGDLHLSNVASHQKGYIFFDWTDACVSHPFMDALIILHEKHPQVQNRLRNAYLSLWSDMVPMEQLLAAWKFARPLCLAHQVISYQHIVRNLELASKHELEDGLCEFARQLLKEFP